MSTTPETAAPGSGAGEQSWAPDVFSSGCSSRQTLQHLTGRWGALTVAALAGGSLRFSDLRRRIDGVSERMLSQTLGQLERDGLVTRTVLSTIPPRVEYALTALGEAVAPGLLSLIGLVEQSMPQVWAAQEAYDRRQAGGPVTR